MTTYFCSRRAGSPTRPSTTNSPIHLRLMGPSRGTMTKQRWAGRSGGGFEIFLRDHWTFRGDAAYVDLGTDNNSFSSIPAAVLAVSCHVQAKFEDSFWVTRIGLTYLFSAVAEPLPPEYAPEYGPVK